MKRPINEIFGDLIMLSERSLVDIHNEMTLYGNYDNYIYNLDDDFLSGYSVVNAVKMVSRADHFDYNDNYVVINYNRDSFETCDFPMEEGWIQLKELANFLLDTVAGEKIARQYGIELEIDEYEEGGEED